MNSENLPVSELGESEASRTDRILDVLNEMPFASSGRAGDLTNWNQIQASLRGITFESLDDFRNTVVEKMSNAKWIDENVPETISNHLDGVVELIKAWQEKKE